MDFFCFLDHSSLSPDLTYFWFFVVIATVHLFVKTESYTVPQASLELSICNQIDLELMAIFFPQPSKCWDYRT